MSDIVYKFSGIHIPGEGVIDQVEGGRIFGHLDNGLMFMLDSSNVTSFEQQDERKEFETFFMGQPFYLQLKYIHGDRLFDFDAGIGYRNLTVQVGYVCWCKEDREFVV